MASNAKGKRVDPVGDGRADLIQQGVGDGADIWVFVMPRVKVCARGNWPVPIAGYGGRSTGNRCEKTAKYWRTLAMMSRRSATGSKPSIARS